MSQNRPIMRGGVPRKISNLAAPSSSTGTRADASNVQKRLQKELMTLMSSGDSTISAFPIGDSLVEWRGTIKAPAGTVYEGLTYKLLLTFPHDYPFTAPKVRFETPCYHPNVSEGDGEICLDILKDKWSALYDVRTILVSIQSLLGDPNNSSPLNAHAARLWDDQQAYKQHLHLKYKADVIDKGLM